MFFVKENSLRLGPSAMFAENSTQSSRTPHRDHKSWMIKALSTFGERPVANSDSVEDQDVPVGDQSEPSCDGQGHGEQRDKSGLLLSRKPVP